MAIDAYHDKWLNKQNALASKQDSVEAAKNSKMWHKVDSWQKGWMVMWVAIFMNLHYFGDWITWVMLWSLIYFVAVIRMGIFQLWLNLWQKLPWDYKGKNDPFQKFGYWAFMGVMILIFNIFYWHVIKFN